MQCTRCKNDAAPNRKRCTTCLDKDKQTQRAYLKRHPERKSAATERWRQKNLDHVSSVQRARQQAARLAAITHYGGCCACCGETYIPFLDIDHVNGGGSAHRKQYTNPVAYYRGLMAGEYSEPLQVLCGNCHHAKTRKYSCPPSHINACDS